MSEDLRQKMGVGSEILKRMNQYKFEARAPEEMVQLFQELVVVPE